MQAPQLRAISLMAMFALLGVPMFSELEGELHASFPAFAEPVRTSDRWNPRSYDRPIRKMIRICRGDAALEEVGRLRYQLYIARDSKPYHADHEAGIFLEPIDQTSLNLCSIVQKRLGASLRISIGSDALQDVQLKPLVEIFRRLTQSNLSDVLVCSRFASLPSLSARASIIPMFKQAYKCALLQGLREAILGTRPGLRSVFERFGFEAYGEAYLDNMVGPLVPMKLDLWDFRRLESLNSPLVEIFAEVSEER